MRVRPALLILMVMGCTREGASPPALARNADSLAEYLDDSDGCGFVPVARSTGPTDLVREYVRRDGEGEFLTSNPWLDSALTCAGHLPGWDVSTLISGTELALLDSSATRVRVRVRYTVNGWHSGSLHLEPTKIEVDTFVVVPTPWGWRIDGPQLNQHVLPLVMSRGFQLHGTDSLAIDALVGPMPPRYSTSTALVIPGVEPGANLAGGRWLGVYPNVDSSWELRDTRVIIKRVHDECIGSDQGIPSTTPEGARFAISELLGVSSGPVEAFWNGHDFVRPADTLAVTREGRRASLRATGREVDTMNTRLYLDYRLWIKIEEGSAAESTSVWSGQFSETYPTIHWVGDLNHDRFPDVLMAVPGEGYGFRYRLLLSERGSQGVAFRTAAEVQVSDC